jgi:predicted ATPase/DNA-binding winged helix-turn-helix (wHTH) protein/tetratricopeptide (TPR) repeat protein
VRFEHRALVIDTDRFVIEQGGKHLHVEPQVFDVLSYLIRHRDRVVSKEELLDEIWGDRFVSESALTSRIKSVRQVVGDSGAAQRSIKTIHGRGYRWVGDVVVADPIGAGGEASSATPAYPAPATILPPRALTSLVGRERQVESLGTAIADRRLVTLVGPPGVGKSRLAGEVALDAANRPDGEVAFADLRRTTHRSDVIGVLRRSVNVAGAPADDEAAPLADHDASVALLVAHLRNRRLLLVLDNCEHVTSDLAEIVPRLIRSCPGLSILATGRRSLGAEGEFVWVVEPMPAPGSAEVTWPQLLSSDAGRLFVERSRAAGARWDETAEQATSIAELCRRLDGLPLAIELAAARTRWLSIEDLLRQLAHELEGPTASSGDPLHAALRSSRSLLTSEQQRAFDALSVFAASFTIDAALSVIGAVCPDGDALEIFEGLVDHSLVDVISGPRHRYRLLETIQRYAELCRIESAQDDVAVLAHFDHYLRFVVRRWPVGLISTAHPWSTLTAEKTEIEAAVRRMASIDGRAARQLLGALGWYWWIGGDAPLWEELSASVEATASEDPSEVAAPFLWVRALAQVLMGGDPGELAREALDRAREAGQWSVAAWALAFSVAPDMMWADLAAVTERWDEIVALFRRSDDTCGEAWAMVYVLGHAQACARRHDDAAATHLAAASIFERCGDRGGRARALLEIVELHIWRANDLERARAVYRTIPRLDDLPVESWMKRQWLGGLIAEGDGDHDEAVRLHLQALTTSERHFPAARMTNTYRCLAAAALRRAGRLAEASDLLVRAIEFITSRRTSPGSDPQAAWVLESAAGLLLDLGEAVAAAQVMGAAERIRAELHAPMPYWDVPRYDPDVQRARTELGDQRFRSTVQAGRRLEVTRSFALVQEVLSTPAATAGTN